MMCTPSRERDFAGLQLSAVRRRSALLDAAADFRTVADNAALDQNRKKDAIAKEVARILAEAERVDAEEDQKYGPDRRGDELPEELRSKEGRLKEAKARLEEEERQAQREQEAPRGRSPSNATLRERRERKPLTKRGRTAYKKRGATIEPVFGQMAMRGLNRFWLRGIGKVKGEWFLWQRHARPGAGDGARAISRSAPMAWLREVDTPP